MSFKPTDYLPYDFANRRHIGPSPEEIREMLNLIRRFYRRYSSKKYQAKKTIRFW